jgi:hypothetical protein
MPFVASHTIVVKMDRADTLIVGQLPDLPIILFAC